MDYNLLSNLENCRQVFLDSQGLVYYTHLLPAALCLLVGGYIFLKRREVVGRLLAFISLLFSLYVLLDLLLWVETARSSLVMVSWSLLGLVSAVLFFCIHWFVHVFANQKPLPLWMILVWTIALIPICIFTPTFDNISGFDLAACGAVENTFFTNYYYALGLLAAAGMTLSIMSGTRAVPNTTESLGAKWFAYTGAELFVIVFLSTGIIASYLVDSGVIPDYGIDQYGLIAMGVFIGLLGYATVRYHAFNMKLLGTQVLVLALILLTAAEYLFVQNTTNQWLISFTLLLVAFFGWILVSSVKREVEQRHRIEKLAEELEETNKRQEGLLHFIGHEVKGFLTKDMGAFAALADGDVCSLPDGARPFIVSALAQTREGVQSVTNLLEASNQKTGKVNYKNEPFDLKSLVMSMVDKVKPNAEKKSLKLALSIEEGEYQVVGDQEKFGDHVLRNLIDNAINYTPSGSIEVSLVHAPHKILFTVSDTGVGISDEDKKRLFTEGGHGKDSLKVNVHSTGYGLYIAKNIVEAHKGTIRAESDGPGKGSRFIVELPV